MSRRTGAKKHIHKYYKRPDGLWACAGIDGCTHFMPSNMIPAPLGYQTVCWKCDFPTQLTPLNMKMDKPECDDCSGVDLISDFIEQKEREARLARLHAPKIKPKEIESIESEYVHASDCEVWNTGECTCQ